MAVIINGDTGIDKITDGSVVADDLASTLDLSSKTITLATDAVDQLSTASGSAPSYSARAWVNFQGTGTVAIRGSGNVSSITDNGTGDYTVNFTTAMPDTNYSFLLSIGGAGDTASSNSVIQAKDWVTAPQITSLRVQSSLASNGTARDFTRACVGIFR